MPNRRLSILPAVANAYGDAWRALRAMRALVGSVLLIVLALRVAEDLVPKSIWSSAILGTALGFAVDIVRSFCLAPFMIAVHRFILRGDVTRGYAPDPSQPGFMAFFGWLVGLSAISALAFSLPDLVVAIGLSITAGLASFVIGLAVIATVTLRLSLIFPALAIDARGANAANALADIKGHALNLLLVFVLALLPCVAVAFAVTLMLGHGIAVPGSALAIINMVIGALIQTFILTLCVAIASQAFQAFSARLLRTA